MFILLKEKMKEAPDLLSFSEEPLPGHCTLYCPRLRQSYMGAPAEVGHLPKSSVSEFPLEEFMDVTRQVVTNLTQNNQKKV